jgi:hypothetical protein
MSTETTTISADRVQSLAQSLDCLTEDDLCVLYKITPATAETWRKRGTGPSYILAGNRYLYPRLSVAADLQTRVRERGASGKAVL